MRAVTGNDFPFVPTGPACHVIHIIRGKKNFNIGESLGFASFTDDDVGQFLLSLTDACRYLCQISRPFYGGRSFPLILRFLCGIDRFSGIFNRPVGHQ